MLGKLARPLAIVDAQRRELLRRLRDAQRAAMTEPHRSNAAGSLPPARTARGWLR